MAQARIGVWNVTLGGQIASLCVIELTETTIHQQGAQGYRFSTRVCCGQEECLDGRMVSSTMALLVVAHTCCDACVLVPSPRGRGCEDAQEREPYATPHATSAVRLGHGAHGLLHL